MRWKKWPGAAQSTSCHCLSEAACCDVQNLQQHRQIPSRTGLRISPSASRRRCRRHYTLFTPGHVNLRLSSHGAFLPWSRRSLKARIGHSCVRSNAPESGCTQYAIGRQEGTRRCVERAWRPPVRQQGHARTDMLLTSTRSRIDRESRIPFTFLIPRQLKKIIRLGTRARMRPNLTERRNRQE